MPDFISSLVTWKRENALALSNTPARRRAGTGFVTGLRLGRLRVHALRALFRGCARPERRTVRLAGSALSRLLQARAADRGRADDVPRRGGRGGDRRQFTSKAGIKPDDYVEALERRWASPVPQERVGAIRGHAGAGSTIQAARPGSDNREARDGEPGRLVRATQALDQGAGMLRDDRGRRRFARARDGPVRAGPGLTSGAVRVSGGRDARSGQPPTCRARRPEPYGEAFALQRSSRPRCPRREFPTR